MDPSTELRKVPIGTINALVNILEDPPSWKELLFRIPKENSTTFEPKYKMEHLTLVQNASVLQKRSCTEIFFEEWGTSGKKRPTLSYLLQLLTEAQLYRAAEYIAVDVLKGSPPARPDKGPAAKVDVSLSHLLLTSQISQTDNDIESTHQASDGLNTLNKNLNDKIKYDKHDERNKEYLFESKKSAAHENSNQSEVSRQTVESYINTSASDMIHFSRTGDNCSNTASQYVVCDIPAISMLLHDETVEPIFANDNGKDNSSVDNSNDSSRSNASPRSSSPIKMGENFSMPIIVDSTTGSSSENFSISQSGLQVAIDIPNISILQGSSSEYKTSEQMYVSDRNLPALSTLQSDSSDIYIPTTSINASIPLTGSSLPITSSSLKTILPHYKYIDLERATNSFHDQMHKKDDNSFAGKLGAGGFGQVYLANGLQHLPYPVAVKKLSFFNTIEMFAEDVISKQFKNEVEILSNYSHENVISLLGYSCDGPNYCLIYEYVDGGSLLENIAANSKNLTASIRINIAHGCAIGIDYLHNSQKTPLIHRDIKSANIILTKSFTPKLCDFGLVKMPNQSFTRNVAGTTAYMAPEAFRGDVSVQMDVFSFGVVILELLTGLPPMQEDRLGIDIVTYVEGMCPKGTIGSLLDASAGQWDCSNKLYNLVVRCLKEKRNRPFISEVKQELFTMIL